MRKNLQYKSLYMQTTQPPAIVPAKEDGKEQAPLIQPRHLLFMVHPDISNFFGDGKGTSPLLISSRAPLDASDIKKSLPKDPESDHSEEIFPKGKKIEMTTELDEFDFWFDYI